ncbi:hypothetical protein Gocc_1318 [Gaiella occulta]|uniref:Uncharacterized protein n=2 Tax=Gaiella occulta TaxID=1002870 RepID=A0A7M2YZK6_9ACTN|nr:hypothetical protein Gocc_1318 [Gaiella occulta]
MAAAWNGAAAEPAVDPDVRTAAENAVDALDDVLQARTREIVVVTSAWHAEAREGGAPPARARHRDSRALRIADRVVGSRGAP